VVDDKRNHCDGLEDESTRVCGDAAVLKCTSSIFFFSLSLSYITPENGESKQGQYRSELRARGRGQFSFSFSRVFFSNALTSSPSVAHAELRFVLLVAAIKNYFVMLSNAKDNSHTDRARITLIFFALFF
jgi:hypothetical protein